MCTYVVLNFPPLLTVSLSSSLLAFQTIGCGSFASSAKRMLRNEGIQLLNKDLFGALSNLFSEPSTLPFRPVLGRVVEGAQKLRQSPVAAQSLFLIQWRGMLKHLCVVCCNDLVESAKTHSYGLIHDITDTVLKGSSCIHVPLNVLLWYVGGVVGQAQMSFFVRPQAIKALWRAECVQFHSYRHARRGI